MITIDQVAAMAMAMPEVTQGERYRQRTWFVGNKAMAWERPFGKADLKRFGDETPPAGPILAITTADLAEKEAVLAAHPGPVFTIPHFDGYAAVLVQLDRITKPVLRELLEDGWLAAAPKALADKHFPSR